MYKKILIATDGSNCAQNVVEYGLQLAKSIGSSVIFVTVTELWSLRHIAEQSAIGTANPIEAFENAESDWASHVLNQAGELAKKFGVTCTSIHERDRDPANGIIKTAENEGCDLIIMGSHGLRSSKNRFLGSKASEVLISSTIPVLIVK